MAEIQLLLEARDQERDVLGMAYCWLGHGDLLQYVGDEGFWEATRVNRGAWDSFTQSIASRAAWKWLTTLYLRLLPVRVAHKIMEMDIEIVVVLPKYRLPNPSELGMNPRMQKDVPIPETPDGLRAREQASPIPGTPMLDTPGTPC